MTVGTNGKISVEDIDEMFDKVKANLEATSSEERTDGNLTGVLGRLMRSRIGGSPRVSVYRRLTAEMITLMVDQLLPCLT